MESLASGFLLPTRRNGWNRARVKALLSAIRLRVVETERTMAISLLFVSANALIPVPRSAGLGAATEHSKR